VETGECSIDDDFEQLVPLLCAADVVVFASPLYWYSFTAQLKTVIDRMFAVAVSKKLKAGLGTVLLGACGDETVSSFDGMRRSYEIMVDFCKWEDLGQVYATGVYDLGAIAGHEALGRARELGAGIG
jgi:multimeric flavodoxin WrbA